MGHILILEDDFILANDFASALKACGHDVSIVGTASEAIELCEVIKVDLAIVDIFIRRAETYIPDGGLSLISKLRHTRGFKTSQQTPIIAVSGGSLVQSQHDPLVSAEAIGATMTMTKPVDLLVLVDTVDKLLSAAAL